MGWRWGQDHAQHIHSNTENSNQMLQHSFLNCLRGSASTAATLINKTTRAFNALHVNSEFEYNPRSNKYTGRTHTRTVSTILSDAVGFIRLNNAELISKSETSYY
jgi:hypothetical protein